MVGRHHALVANNEHLLLIDLARVYDSPQVLGEWDSVGGTVDWLDADTAVVGGRLELIRITVSGPRDNATPVPLRDVTPAQTARVIPRLQ